MKDTDYIYGKILRDVKRYLSIIKDDTKLSYIDTDGDEFEAVFDDTPTGDEIEGLLIFLNKDKIAHA